MQRSIIVAACVVAVWGSVASGDVVVLKNGDRVSGKIETLADGKLRVKSDLMGAVTVDLANVQTFSSDEPITLLFKDGTIVHQKVASAEIRAALTKALFASFKVLVGYDSQPAAGREKTDIEYILGVGINF